MRHVIYNCLSGYHSHGCGLKDTPKINFSIFIEDPYKIAGITYEPDTVDAGTSTYYCEIGHYLKSIINGSGRILLTTVVSEELSNIREVEYQDMVEKIFPLLTSKFIARSMIEYAYEEKDHNMKSSIYALRFANNMLEMGKISPVTPTQGRVTEDMFDRTMTKTHDLLATSQVRLKPEKVLINDELLKIRKASINAIS